VGMTSQSEDERGGPVRRYLVGGSEGGGALRLDSSWPADSPRESDRTVVESLVKPGENRKDASPVLETEPEVVPRERAVSEYQETLQVTDLDDPNVPPVNRINPTQFETGCSDSRPPQTNYSNGDRNIALEVGAHVSSRPRHSYTPSQQLIYNFIQHQQHSQHQSSDIDHHKLQDGQVCNIDALRSDAYIKDISPTNPPTQVTVTSPRQTQVTVTPQQSPRPGYQNLPNIQFRPPSSHSSQEQRRGNRSPALTKPLCPELTKP
jgi:hypothetical protein